MTDDCITQYYFDTRLTLTRRDHQHLRSMNYLDIKATTKGTIASVYNEKRAENVFYPCLQN